MTAETIIRCLDKPFVLCGTAAFVHSANGPAFVSGDIKKHLPQWGIASSSSSIHHPPEMDRPKNLLALCGKQCS